MGKPEPKYRTFQVKNLEKKWVKLNTASCKSSLLVHGLRPNASECLHKTQNKKWVIEVIFDGLSESVGHEISPEDAVNWMAEIGANMMGDLDIFEHLSDFDSARPTSKGERVTTYCVRCRAMELRLSTGQPGTKRHRIWTTLRGAETPLSAMAICERVGIKFDSAARGILSSMQESGVVIKLFGKNGYIANTNKEKLDLS